MSDYPDVLVEGGVWVFTGRLALRSYFGAYRPTGRRFRPIYRFWHSGAARTYRPAYAASMAAATSKAEAT